MLTAGFLYLKIMKLISMTDFVLRINELVPKEREQFFQSWQNKKLMIIENYANFLKEPLKLEMFIPYDNHTENEVLFKGFEHGYKWYETFIVMRDKVSGRGQFQLSKYKRIEGLLNDEFDFILTESCINRIFG